MAELSALSALLHALQVKLGVAEQATHPKVFMWSAPWEEEEEPEQQQQQQEEMWNPTGPIHNTMPEANFLLPPVVGGAASDFQIRPPPAAAEDEGVVAGEGLEPPLSSAADGPSSVPTPSVSCDNHRAEVKLPADRTSLPAAELLLLSAPTCSKEMQSDALQLAAETSAADGERSGTINSGNRDAENPSVSVPPAAANTSLPAATSFNSQPPGVGGSNCDLANAPDPFSFFDFPSLNEVKELLPSVLKDISCMEDLTAAQGRNTTAAAAPLTTTTPAVTLIPEPKLINREESRLNLIGHIEHLQGLVEQRLDLVEERLLSLEQLPHQQQQQQLQQQQQQQQLPDTSNIAQAVGRLLTDIQSMMKANALLPDKI
jgi:hypothetical protein